MHSCGLSRHSCDLLSHLLVRGRVNTCVVVIDLITIIAVFSFGGGVGGIFRVIVGAVLSLEEQALVSVLDVKAPGTAMCKTMHTIDGIL